MPVGTASSYGGDRHRLLATVGTEGDGVGEEGGVRLDVPHPREPWGLLTNRLERSVRVIPEGVLQRAHRPPDLDQRPTGLPDVAVAVGQARPDAVVATVVTPDGGPGEAHHDNSAPVPRRGRDAEAVEGVRPTATVARRLTDAHDGQGTHARDVGVAPGVGLRHGVGRPHAVRDEDQAVPGVGVPVGARPGHGVVGREVGLRAPEEGRAGRVVRDKEGPACLCTTPSRPCLEGLVGHTQTLGDVSKEFDVGGRSYLLLVVGVAPHQVENEPVSPPNTRVLDILHGCLHGERAFGSLDITLVTKTLAHVETRLGTLTLLPRDTWVVVGVGYGKSIQRSCPQRAVRVNVRVGER